MIDFTPAPQAASRTRQITAHALTEAKLMARNGEQLLLALVIPIGLLMAGRFAGASIGWTFDSLVASVFALAIWSTCFTSLAIVTGFERRYGVLERLNATCLGRSGLLAGKALAMAGVTASQLVILAAVAVLLGWRPAVFWWPVVPAAPLAMITFSALALALAGTLRAEATLGLANLIYLSGLAAGIIVPLGAYPEATHLALSILPTMALGEVLRGSAGLSAVAVLLVWAVAASALARKVFRWTS